MGIPLQREFTGNNDSVKCLCISQIPTWKICIQTLSNTLDPHTTETDT